MAKKAPVKKAPAKKAPVAPPTEESSADEEEMQTEDAFDTEGEEGTDEEEDTEEEAFDTDEEEDTEEEAGETTEDAFDTSAETDDAYEGDDEPADAYEQDSGADESIDLGDTPDEAPAPPSGWHKVKCGYFSSKPSKAGDKKWAFVLNFQDGYSHWEHFALGSPTGADFAQRALKTFARACGVGDVEGKEGVLAPFKPSDLLDCYLYVNITVDPKSSFPVNVTGYAPETDPPSEDVVSDQAEADDGLPF